ncbi:hypothetical protein EI94DRAFT_1817911 [Lactarius quietus]|nr:hypothetical protein EI94DRAFT_1817911 [Lactarius quietus]
MSFLSVEPQSRIVLKNYSNSLLAQLDSQLGIISDRYLAFFRERRTIEATYIDSLRRLHLKAKTVDASHDPLTEPTTTRAAWDKVTDDLEREANTQQEFVDILDKDVINPLAAFKEKKEESRKRIEEDLESSTARYADFVENRISELQETYFKKYHPQNFVHSTGGLQRSQDISNNRLRGRQDDLGDPDPTNNEQDSDFRFAVRYLNNCRLRRAEYLVTDMTAASAKYDNLARSTTLEVEKAIARRDPYESDLRASFRRALSFSIPPPTFYRKYCPGVHSDLIFGAPLMDVETNEDNVPKVLRKCMEEVERRDLNTKGIYSNEMTVEVLAVKFRGGVFRGNEILQDGVSVKGLVLEDLIQNVHTLFDERPSTSPPVPPPHAAETTSLVSSGSFLSSELPQSPKADAIQHRPGLVGVVPTSTQSSFTLLPSDAPLESRFTPSPTAWPSRLLELPSSNTVVERAETASQEQVTPEGRGTEAGDASVNSPPPEVVAGSVVEWRLRQSQLPPQPEAVTIPQSPPESVFSSSSDLPLSSVMSL